MSNLENRWLYLIKRPKSTGKPGSANTARPIIANNEYAIHNDTQSGGTISWWESFVNRQCVWNATGPGWACVRRPILEKSLMQRCLCVNSRVAAALCGAEWGVFKGQWFARCSDGLTGVTRSYRCPSHSDWGDYMIAWPGNDRLGMAYCS